MEEIYREFKENLTRKYTTYRIVYKGQGVSLNDWYSQGHWSKRSALKKKYVPIFKEQFREIIGKDILKKFVVILEYNSKHDTDNITGLEKLFTDALKINDKNGDGEGWILDDAKKYFRLYLVKPNEELEKNEFVFYVTKLE